MTGKEDFPSNILSSFKGEEILVLERNERASWLFTITAFGSETWN